nr:Gfo/Idh/MocA family oxidoreductase [Cryobacterium sp. Y50]
MGISGSGRIADRFILESKFVSGVNVESVYSSQLASAQSFCNRHELARSTSNYDEFLESVDAVYIASPHEFHFEQACTALRNGKHVLCEKPLTMSFQDSEELHNTAEKHGVVLLEAIKTAYSPGFIRMIAIARSGVIGTIRDVSATFTKIALAGSREVVSEFGGSARELASYPLLAIVKLLGTDLVGLEIDTILDPTNRLDLFTKMHLRYNSAFATATVALGAKAEGNLVVAGTLGSLYVPSPWWKTEQFETRFEDPAHNKKYFFKFDGDGLRYELAEFVSLINSKETTTTFKLSRKESLFIQSVLDAGNVALLSAPNTTESIHVIASIPAPFT